MSKTFSVAALAAALFISAGPLAHAQDATQPPSAPNPSEVKGGTDAGGGDAAKSDDSAKKGGAMTKKSSKHHSKKHKM